MWPKESKRSIATLVAVFAATMLLLVGSAFGQSTSDVAGVWSFNGGQVGVVKNADKSFTGTVVRATKTGACVHPIGEKMWTDIRLGGGSLNWWGKHVWFLTQPCRVAPSTGNTAWKIFKDANGKMFLRGCYANWANPAVQPQIDNAGASDPGAGGSCIDSYRVASKTGKFSAIARFPKSKCLGKKLKLRFVDPPTDALATVQISAGKVKRTLTRTKLTLNLRITKGAGKVKVKVLAKTLLGQKITGGATYKTC